MDRCFIYVLDIFHFFSILRKNPTVSVDMRLDRLILPEDMEETFLECWDFLDHIIGICDHDRVREPSFSSTSANLRYGEIVYDFYHVPTLISE